MISADDFKIDVSDFNITHVQNYDANELAAIEQQSFTDVWVSFNGTALGYWPLPCTIPLLPDYNSKNLIHVIPCVRIRNTSTTTLQYIFVTHGSIEPGYGYQELLDMENEREYHLSDFILKYGTSVTFPILETFTQSTDFKPLLPDEFPVNIEPWFDNQLQKNIGRIVLSDTSVFFDVGTSFFPLQGKGSRQFWEISYKTVNGGIVTHLGYENTVSGIDHDNMVIFPSTEGVWKKAYIDITKNVMQASSIASQVSTRLRITGTRNKTDADSYYYFENIKLITMDAPYY
jgi:hypothetical protein